MTYVSEISGETIAKIRESAQVMFAETSKGSAPVSTPQVARVLHALDDDALAVLAKNKRALADFANKRKTLGELKTGAQIREALVAANATERQMWNHKSATIVLHALRVLKIK